MRFLFMKNIQIKFLFLFFFGNILNYYNYFKTLLNLNYLKS